MDLSGTTVGLRRGAALALILSVLALGVVACSSSSDDEPVETERSTTTEEEDETPETTRARRSTTTVSGGSAGTAVADEVDEEVDATTWTEDAVEFRGRDGDLIAFDCAPNGTIGTVWGSGTYTDDSSVCSAAVHAGLITASEGGLVVIEIRPGEDSYQGTTANGVTTLDYPEWDGSYVFVEG